ncbi:hypothetical protein pdam_00021398 [Pocillopora damicornis]|uniref:Uncharacterized protein n=1 Tax=Pocillopora damicornis TaxID=46731 RepID=A0A3M6TN12_POCDA|nr:hypothetical protein pdam_00021398 [Pocillopora damicornis]
MSSNGTSKDNCITQMWNTNPAILKNATKYLPQKKGNVPKRHEIFKPSEIRDKATPLYLLDTYNTREKDIATATPKNKICVTIQKGKPQTSPCLDFQSVTY